MRRNTKVLISSQLKVWFVYSWWKVSGIGDENYVDVVDDALFAAMLGTRCWDLILQVAVLCSCTEDCIIHHLVEGAIKYWMDRFLDDEYLTTTFEVYETPPEEIEQTPYSLYNLHSTFLVLAVSVALAAMACAGEFVNVRKVRKCLRSQMEWKIKRYTSLPCLHIAAYIIQSSNQLRVYKYVLN